MNISDVNSFFQGEMNGTNQDIMAQLLAEVQSVKEGAYTRYQYVEKYSYELFCRGISREEFLAYAREHISEY